MHPSEAEKQRHYRWWMDFFLPAKFRLGSRDERYRLGLLIVAMLGALVSGLIFVTNEVSLPMPWFGRLGAGLLVLVPGLVLMHVRWTGKYRQSALYFTLLATPLAVAHMLTLKTIYIGYFHWVPWIIIFACFLAGLRQGLIVAALVLLQTLWVLHKNSSYGHTVGVYGTFNELFFHLLANQILAALAITAMMFTLALHHDRMEDELETQQVLRAQTAHKTTMGAMLGNLAHEVNNPLAIVHTALVHYQRLLQTNRLVKSVQLSLIERMGEALERLRQVVKALTSAADWEDREAPCSFAVTHADQNRLPQFGDLQLVQSHESHSGKERWPRQWFSRLIPMLTHILDQILPSVTGSWSTSQRFRARSTALICIIGSLAMLITLLQQLLIEKADELILMTTYIFCGVGVLSMLALKLTPKPQVIGVGYIILLFSVAVGLAGERGQSILAPVLYWIPLMMASLFMVTKPITALTVSLMFLVGQIALMNQLREYGLQISFEQTFTQYVERLQSTMVLSNITVFVLAAAFISLMNSTYNQLVVEKNWHLLSARMRELNALADSAAVLIGNPLKHLAELRRDLQVEGHNPDILQKMLIGVEQINRVSQSFALLSRPQVNEDVQSIDGRVWKDHIHNICFRRAAEAGWVLSMQVKPQGGMITGPLGRLTMLVITALKEAMGDRAPQNGSPLELDVVVESETTRVRIQYAVFQESKAAREEKRELEEALRVSLLQELLESLQASLVRRQKENLIILELQWRHVDFQENPRP